MAASQRITFPMSLILANERAELSLQVKLYIDRWRVPALENGPLSRADAGEALIDALVIVKAFSEHLVHEQAYFDRQRDTLPADGELLSNDPRDFHQPASGVSGPRPAEPMARTCPECRGVGRVNDGVESLSRIQLASKVCPKCFGSGDVSE